MRYRFLAKGKFLFYTAAFICLISIIMAPAGIVFIYMAIAAGIEMDDHAFTYRMLRKRVIPFEQMSGLVIGKPQRPAYYVDVDPGGYRSISFATVIPLKIELHGGKKMKLSLNFFENPAGIIESLREKTGLTVKNENGEDIPF